MRLRNRSSILTIVSAPLMTARCLAIRCLLAIIAAAAGMSSATALAAQSEFSLISQPAGGAKANAGSYDPVVSRDGRFVAFESDASNLHPDDRDHIRDVFVRDMTTGMITLVSRADGAMGQKGSSLSDDPSVSADGRFVAFTSEAENLTAGVPANSAQVYVRDLVNGSTTLVSRANGAQGAIGESFSSEPSISGDGRLVAFRSTSSLVPDDAGGMDVYVRDLAAQTVELASRGPGVQGAAGNADSFHPSVAVSGSQVAFTSYATNLHPDDVPPNAAIYVRDLATKQTKLESRASGRRGDPGNSESASPLLSADSRTLVFRSDSTNLVAERDNPVTDFFARNLATGSTRSLSSDLHGRARNDRTRSGSLAISSSARRVAFSYQLEPKRRRSPDPQRVFVVDVRRDNVDVVRRIAARVRSSADEVQLSLAGNGRWLAAQSTKRISRLDTDDVADIYLGRLGDR